MWTPKLTKRQREVINLLTAMPGRRLELGKGGYLNIVGAHHLAVPGTRGVAPIVAEALAKHGLLDSDRRPTTLAIELFAETQP
jgi:hypothetical protein